MNTSSGGIGSFGTLCIVSEHPLQPSETFIRQHIDGWPGCVAALHGRRPMLGGLRLPAIVARLSASRWLRPADDAVTAAYVRAFERFRPAAVLAEYGPAGVMVVDACRRLDIPLVVHFHGYDASLRDVVDRYAEGYRRIFAYASAVVAVSHEMTERLVALGAPAQKVAYNPYGVDTHQFTRGNPAAAPPVFLAVGRLVHKKGPLHTLRAFAQVLARHPEARLRVVGDGPLRRACADEVRALGLASAVTLLGARSHGVVAAEMRRARAFVQHSLEAFDGDREGTPVAILEAGATGLPVVATRHGGIPDVVVEGDTGLLVEEGDVDGMAAAMARLVEDPGFAARLGRAGQEHVSRHFRNEVRLAGLWTIILATARS